MRDSAGVVIVESQAVADTLAPGEDVLRLGSVDGPGALFQVRHVFPLPDGGVAVVETSTNLVRFYDADGNETRSVGGAGDGPGEFRALWWALQTEADTLIAFDLMYPATVSVFDPAGAFVREFSLPRVGPGEPVPRGGWSNGDIVVLLQSTGEPPQPGEHIHYGLYTATSSGETGQDFGRWPMSLYRGTTREIFAYRASFGAAADAFLYTPGDRYEVRRYDRSGALRSIARVNRARVPVTNADREVWRDEVWSRIVGTPLEARMGEPVFADSMPAYTSVVAGQHGGFWAERAGSQVDTAIVWDVFDADAVYTGSLLLPERFAPMALTADRVYGVERDQNDVEFVVVYAWGVERGS